MLQRGAEVRAQSMRAAPAAAPLYPGAVNPNYPPAQAYNYGTQPLYPNYAPSYPAYSDTYPTDTYDYPAYNYGYSWPYCGSSFYCGLGCYPYGGYCGYPYGCFGYGYPYGWGGCGYYGRGYYGGGYYGRGYYGGRGYGGYYGGRGYVGGRGYYGFGARSAAFAGSGGGFARPLVVFDLVEASAGIRFPLPVVAGVSAGAVMAGAVMAGAVMAGAVTAGAVTAGVVTAGAERETLLRSGRRCEGW